jgi:hypothetical protein
MRTGKRGERHIELVRPATPHRGAARRALRYLIAFAALLALIFAAGTLRPTVVPPAAVTVEPHTVTITAVPTTTTVATTATVATPDTIGIADGLPTALLAAPVHVKVLAGKAQWLADDALGVATDGDTRILAGKVLYAIGDNHAWQLVAYVTGAEGSTAKPECVFIDQPLAGDTPRVIAGEPVIISKQPILICEGVEGHSGGIFRATLDIEGTASGEITVKVDLIP